jgi:hypothetical protein
MLTQRKWLRVVIVALVVSFAFPNWGIAGGRRWVTAGRLLNCVSFMILSAVSVHAIKERNGTDVRYLDELRSSNKLREELVTALKGQKEASREALTRQTISVLYHLSIVYLHERETTPRDLEELLHAAFPTEKEKREFLSLDGWEHKIRMFHFRNGWTFVSDGPDGKPGTDDDIGTETPETPPRIHRRTPPRSAEITTAEETTALQTLSGALYETSRDLDRQRQ